jgi:hypothetical protein
MRRAAAVLCIALSGCGEEIAEPGRVLLVEGADGDAWTAEPVPVTVEVDKTLASGDTVLLESATAPLESFSLGRGGVGRYVVTGKDAAGAVQARARSLPIDPAGFAERSLPLFVGRSERFSRAPGGLSAGQELHPPAAVLGGRYLFVAGDSYDLGAWTAVGSPKLSCPEQPCRFSSLAGVGETLAGIGVGDDWAIWFDRALSGDQGLPAGLSSWAEVAGGRTLNAPDGSAFIVGPTRPEPPTQWVVEVSREGALFARALAAPRAGAAATWVDGLGLVVAGGNTGASDTGVERLPPGAAAFVQLAYPADPTTGAALVALDGSTVLRAGGRTGSGDPAPSVEIALGCATGCSATLRPELVPLDRAVGFALGDGELIVVGDDPAGETAAARLGVAGLSLLALREPRRGASALAVPTGHIALFGGQRPDNSPALSVELFTR